MATPQQDRSATIIAHNVRRLMAKEGLSHKELVEAVGLDERTLRAVLQGVKQTRGSTLKKVAVGLGVSVDALFQPPMGMSAAAFNLATNPVVEKVAAEHSALFEEWSASDYSELTSRFGHGGNLTEQGVLQAAQQMNERRKLLAKARVILESSQAHLLSELIDVLYRQVTDHR